MDNIELISAPRLTTVDNPYNPFTHFSEWFAFDSFHGYNTCGVLAKRLSQTNLDALSDYEYAELVDKTILDLINDFPLLYRKVNPNDESIMK